MKRLIVLLLVCTLCLSCLSGCKSSGSTMSKFDTEVTGNEVDTRTPEPAPTPTPNPDVPPSPEMVVTNPSAQVPSEKVQVEIHGEEEVVSMTPVSGTFAFSGGPDFTLLVDQERYQVNDISGYCYITMRTGMSGDVYAELGYRAGENAQSIGTSILDEYGMMSSTVNLGQEQLGGYTVQHVQGETIQNIFDAYLLDVEGGCVTIVTSTTSETEAHRARLMASLETLTIS